jgi:hypothetical protein
VRSRDCKADGLFSWEVLSAQSGETSWRGARFALNWLFGYSGVLFLLGLELIAILGIILPAPSVRYYLLPVAIVLAIKLALAYRCGYGRDGSDQMETVVLAGLFSTLCLLHSRAAPIGVWFIASQAALAYCASGVSKILSRPWTSGEAAFKIFNTYAYGTPRIASFLLRTPRMRVPLCWGIIAWECLFPISLLVPVRVAWVILIVGMFFHAFNAFIMGLNKFFWAFLSTYPAILYCNHEAAGWLATSGLPR